MPKSRAFEMLKSGQGADCVIEVVPQFHGQNIKEFKVHKYVLMVNSDVFMAMFSHQNTKEAREGRIRITDSTVTAVRQMLIYMYMGKVAENENYYAIETDALPLMAIADKYLMKPLVDFNAEILSLIQSNVRELDKDDDHPMLRNIRKSLQKKNAHSKMTELWKKGMKSRTLEMFQTGEGADCVIEVVHQQDGLASKQQEKKEFNVHKYVLMVNSDVFLAMISDKNTQEARESRIQITDSTVTAVRQMLIYMYTGKLPQEYSIDTDAGPLMHIANKYQIKPLVQLMEKEMVKSLSMKYVFDWLKSLPDEVTAFRL